MNHFYVAVSGCDTNTGTKEAPFATICRAQEAVRACIAEGLRAPVTVVVGAGNYSIDQLRFDSRDSGTQDCPITYEAEGTVILNGGVRLTAEMFRPLTDEEKSRLHGDAAERVVCADLKQIGLTRADWGEICAIGSHGTAHKYDGAVTSPMACELFFNDSRMTIARYPNEGFLLTEEPIREGNCLEPTGKIRKTTEEWAAIRNPIGDIRRIDAETAARSLTWRSLDNVWTFGYPKYGWAEANSPIVSIDAEACTMETMFVSLFGICEKAPYYLYNIFEELDVPGEWYLERETGLLYLYPPQKLENASILLSIGAKTLLHAEQTAYLTFRGFTFTATRGDAIAMTGSHLTLDACEIKNVAGWAISVKGNDCRIQNCHIHHTGEGGVQLSGGDRVSLTPSGNVVTNNHIHHIAEIVRTYRPGVNLSGVGHVVSHNCIHDSAHMAIGFGGNEHLIEYNEIYNVCQVADDSSAIYTGRDYTYCGSVIRYNYFHDISSEKDTQHIGIFAVYCDDNLGKTEIYGNVMHRCQSALLLHGGHEMTFRNNLIIDACARSQYCLRFHAYGYWQTLVPGGADNIPGTHIENLKAVPWDSGIWKEKYPRIGEYLTWDPREEQYKPHYCDISENMIIEHQPIDIRGRNFNGFADLHNRMVNNVELSDRTFAGIPEGDTLDLSQNRIKEIIPGWEEIPFEKMGMLK